MEVRTDGRNVTEELLGEAGELVVRTPEHAAPAVPAEPPVGYYGLSPIKAPPWKAWVPAYLYVGGVAGGAAVLAGVTALPPALAPLSLRSRRLAAVAVPLG